MEPQVEAPKLLKRPYEDLVHFRVAVPRTYIKDDGDGGLDKEVEYKFYMECGYKGQTIAEIFTEDALKGMGIEGNYDLIYKPDGAWGRKGVILSKNFDVYYVAKEYIKDNDCALILKPKNPIWYKCIALNADEIDAAKKVIDEVDKRLCKRLKTTHNL